MEMKYQIQNLVENAKKISFILDIKCHKILSHDR